MVNPRWRELDRQKRSVKSKLNHRQARFAALTLHPESDESAQAKWEKRKAELLEEIEQLEHELTGIDSQLKTTPSHLDWDKLPESEKFQRLAPSRKQLVDTVKMIAYRAETALASIVREKLARTDDARSLLRDLFCSEADLTPDLAKRVLEVQVHPMSNPRSNRAIAHLLEHLNAAELTYPGTNLQLLYSIAGQAEAPDLAPEQNPADQEVWALGPRFPLPWQTPTEGPISQGKSSGRMCPHPPRASLKTRTRRLLANLSACGEQNACSPVHRLTANETKNETTLHEQLEGDTRNVGCATGSL